MISAAMTDDEKHALSIKRTGYPATFLPRSLYEHYKREEFDMAGYVIQQPMPVIP